MTLELSLGENIVFTGFREDALDLVDAADLFVHSAVYPEPFPRSLLEALALRKPVVAARTGGTPEIVEDGSTGLLVEPSDPISLAEAVSTLLKDRQKAHRLGSNGRMKVERDFTIEKHVALLSEFYEKLLEPS
jgi:glycosyltransferase involved in cell wall biosynthesis